MNDMLPALGRAISTLRTRASLTQAQLSERARLDQGALSKIENGRRDVSTRTLTAIARAIGCDISEIWAVAEQLAGIAPATSLTTLPTPGIAQSKPTHIDLDIDALRYSIGAIAIAITAMQPAVGAKILENLRNAPAEFLEKQGSVVALVEAVEDAGRAAKARKPARPRAGA